MYKILVADDEERIREVIREYSVFEGYSVTEAANGIEAVELCKAQNFDVVVMDIMMPRLDGFSACREIKKIKNVPVLMLSARGEEYDKLLGFQLGIDDYVVKPFSPKELMARLKVIINRNENASRNLNTDERIKIGGLEVDMAGRSVYVDGKITELTPKEFDLLYYLAKNRNIALTRGNILNFVWGCDFQGDDRTVDTHIKMLRTSLGKYRDYITTLRGVGYKFEA